MLTTTGVGPVRVRKLHFYGFTGGFTEIRAPMILPWLTEAQAIKTLMSALNRNGNFYHWCVLDGIQADSAPAWWLAQKAQSDNWVL